SRGVDFDHARIGLMSANIEDLALAYYFTGNETYAKSAANYLRVWFLDPATRMNPNLNYAQAIAGKNSGRGTGIIEGRNLVSAADAAGLLAGSSAWKEKDQKSLDEWISAYLDWLLTSKNGLDEAAATNNHGTFYDTQVVRLALLLNRPELARKVAGEAKEKRIAVQIEPDGKQPLELERTSALGYSKFNLEAMFELATVAERVGVDLWNYQSPQGGGIRKALDFLLPYIDSPSRKWPYKQIKQIEPESFAPLLAQASNVYGDSKYGNILSRMEGLGSKMVKLLYPLQESSLDVAAIDRSRILKAAEHALELKPLSITTVRARLSEGGSNDFYSNGDYWWPDPSKPDGLPYIQRDGQTNPENFNQHRMMIRELRDSVAALSAAYQLTGEGRYVSKAVDLLRVFFLDPETRMNPHLSYAQAIPGVSKGRGIGIIDTLHLIEIPVAVRAIQKSSAFPPQVADGLKKWFADYVDWMISSKNGQDEAAAKNNHAVAFWLQVAAFARFTGDELRLAECRRQFKEVFVSKQMAEDGSFPAELARTKPYAYSIFQLDNMVALCALLSGPDENLWTYSGPGGRSISKAVDYLYPYLADKSKWPLKPDVQAWEGWPSRQPNLLFAGRALANPSYLELWRKLPPDPTDPEVQRNIAITQPLLWLD
ncbi:alginate lyase family protein, partial [bacterium]|nr:alginate lyase family protein [bacterium]